MIYGGEQEYQATFYQDPQTGRSPVLDYIEALNDKEKAKVLKYIEFLREHKGVLDEPYSKHIQGKIRELRVDFAKHRHRIFYFTFIGKNIILLNAFLKKTSKTPIVEIKKAEHFFNTIVINKKFYEKK